LVETFLGLATRVSGGIVVLLSPSFVGKPISF